MSKRLDGPRWGWIVLTTWGLFALLPILYFASIALRPRNEIIAPQPIYFPTLTTETWFKIWTEWPICSYFENSILSITSSVFICLVLGVPCAYALARYRFAGNSDIGNYILSTKMMAPAAVVVPMFFLFGNMRFPEIYLFEFYKFGFPSFVGSDQCFLDFNFDGFNISDFSFSWGKYSIGPYQTLDRWWALGLIYAAMNLSIVVWIVRSYMIDIHPEIEDAARTDGASDLRILWEIIIPMCLPGIITAAVIAAIFAMNEYLFTLIIASKNAYPLSVALANFSGGSDGIIYNAIALVGFLAFFPALLLVILIQNHLSRGLTMGAVKG
jgi:multiple sugar transport system permease protein